MNRIQGKAIATGLKVGIVISRFNSFITDRLLEGAMDAFERHGGDRKDVDVVEVPGAYELPLAAKTLARSGKYDALVTLSAVIRGETPHFDFVCSAASSGISNVTLETGVPIGFGVLTTDTLDQAINRAGSKSGNKGEEALMTAIEMANLIKTLGG